MTTAQTFLLCGFIFASCLSICWTISNAATRIEDAMDDLRDDISNKPNHE